MINLAVINKKDLIKYIFKLAIVVTIITIATKILPKKEASNRKASIINDKNLTACLDQTIPGI